MNRPEQARPDDAAPVEEPVEPMGPADYALAALFSSILVIVLAQVVSRYVLNRSLGWTEELARYLFTWVIFLGAALALRDGQHIRIDAVINRFPPRLQAGVAIFRHVLEFVFLLTLTVIGFKLVERTTGSRSPALGLPVNWAYYAALPVSFLLGLFYIVRRLIGELRARRANQPGRAAS